ncbi:MAG: Clp protease N-terminal domain-containing protein, partial [bacterium]
DGTGSLDFLIAATAAKPVAKVLRQVGIDPAVVAQRADASRGSGSEPGLTADAKRVAEAVARRSLAHRRNMTSIDLLIALAETPGPARDVLIGLGLDEQRLAAAIT